MDGLLLVDKPTGWTSFDVVAKVRSTLRQAKSQKRRVPSLNNKLPALGTQLSAPSPKAKVGHTGTLDPLATGLLILVIGSYTKRAQEFSRLDKTYEVELTLGYTSKTGDAEGPIEPFDSAQGKPSPKQIEETLRNFIGEFLQTPHIHSAIKIDGQRAYKLARAGKVPKLEPRKVSIYGIKNLKISYPKVWFTVDVSSGTYIRSLAVDVGEKLGCGAYMSALNRTRIGKYKLDQAIAINDIKDKLDSSLQSAD